MESYMLLVIVVSAALLALAGYFALRSSERGHRSFWRLISVPLLVVASILVLRFPLYKNEPWCTAFLHGIVSGMQTIGLNESLTELMDKSAELYPASHELYDLYTVLQYVCAPLLCGYTVFRAVIGLRAWRKLTFCSRPVYFFSKLTEEAVILAKSIDQSAHAAGADPLFCFCVPEDDGEYKRLPCWQRAREFGAIAVHRGLTADLFPRGSAHVSCVLCSPDESENIKDLARLLREEAEAPIPKRRMIKHFAFGSSAWAEKAVDALAAGCKDDPACAVFMINPDEHLAAHLLNRYPLHACCGKGTGSRARMNVLVVGSTPLADWFLRTAYACGQLCDCDLSITLADADAEAYRERLLLSAPMLRREEHPLIRDCGALRFVQLGQLQAAADAALLADKDYILLALDADEDNAMLAGQIASFINRQKLTDGERAAQRVTLLYAVRDAGMSRLCSVMSPERTDETFLPCEAIPVGDRESCYRVGVLLEHELRHKAFFVSRAYDGKLPSDGEKPDITTMYGDFIYFMKSAYGRRSSTACALQLDYYRQMQERGGKDMAEKLGDAEHRRWSAYMIMDGYDEPTRAEFEAYFFRGGDTHKSDTLRLHPCLVMGRTDELERLSQALDGLLTARIEEAFAQAGVAFRVPDGERDAVRGAVAKAAEQIADQQLRKKVKNMGKRLRSDFRAADSDILSHTGDIAAMMDNETVQSALNRYWQ